MHRNNFIDAVYRFLWYKLFGILLCKRKDDRIDIILLLLIKVSHFEISLFTVPCNCDDVKSYRWTLCHIRVIIVYPRVSSYALVLKWGHMHYFVSPLPPFFTCVCIFFLLSYITQAAHMYTNIPLQLSHTH